MAGLMESQQRGGDRGLPYGICREVAEYARRISSQLPGYPGSILPTLPCTRGGLTSIAPRFGCIHRVGSAVRKAFEVAVFPDRRRQCRGRETLRDNRSRNLLPSRSFLRQYP